MTPKEAKQVKHLAFEYAAAVSSCTAARGRHWTIKSRRIERRKVAEKKLLDYLTTLTVEPTQ